MQKQSEKPLRRRLEDNLPQQKHRKTIALAKQIFRGALKKARKRCELTGIIPKVRQNFLKATAILLDERDEIPRNPRVKEIIHRMLY